MSIYSIDIWLYVCRLGYKRQKCKKYFLIVKRFHDFSFLLGFNFQLSVFHIFSNNFKELRYLWMSSYLFSYTFFIAGCCHPCCYLTIEHLPKKVATLASFREFLSQEIQLSKLN